MLFSEQRWLISMDGWLEKWTIKSLVIEKGFCIHKIKRICLFRDDECVFLECEVRRQHEPISERIRFNNILIQYSLQQQTHHPFLLIILSTHMLFAHSTEVYATNIYFYLSIS